MFFQIAKKGKTHWKFYFIGILVIFVSLLFANIFASVLLLANRYFTKPDNQNNRCGNFNIDDLQTNVPYDLNLKLFIILIPFLIGVFVIFWIVKLLHKRNVLSVITSRPRFDTKRFLWAFLIWIAIVMTFFIIDYQVNMKDYIYQFQWGSFLGLGLITLTLIPFQAAFEEILFRGYLMQGIGIATRSRWISLLITSFIFGLLHSFNPEVEIVGFWHIMPFYIGFGLLLGIIAIMDNGLELSIGLHTAHNIFSALFVSTEGSVLETNAIFKTRELNIEVSDYLGIFIPFVVLLVFLSWYYKWKSFKKIIEPIKEVN